MKRLMMAVITVGLMAAIPVFAGPTSTFDTDSDGWMTDVQDSVFHGNPPIVITPPTPASFSASGGNPGGYIYGPTDNSAVTEPRFIAPAKFLGDKSAYYGGVITFDTADSLSGVRYNQVELIGNGHTLFYTYLPTDIIPGGTWTSLSAPLAPSALWQLDSFDNGPTPTVAEFQSVLSNLQELNIEGDIVGGADIGSLDNVCMTPGVPDGGTTATLLGMAIAGLAAVRRKLS